MAIKNRKLIPVDYGYVVEGVEPNQQFVTTDPRLLAHDLIEHKDPTKIGSVFDECHALGVYIAGRCQWINTGDNFRSHLQNMALEFEVISYALCDEILPPCYGPWPKHFCSEQFTKIRDYILANNSEKINPRVINNMLKWASKGAKEALNRYGSSQAIYDAFFNVKQRLDEFDLAYNMNAIQISFDDETGEVYQAYEIEPEYEI